MTAGARPPRRDGARSTLEYGDPMTPGDVVAGARPVAGFPIFAFGTEGRAVTVRSQQRRAIHLVDALLHEGVIGAGGHLAVVGAGAAGMTAAVRAASAGCRVLVLESADETLATFRGNTSRLLHPNLYTWPRPGWAHPHAELPILTWSAGSAASVASTLDDAFRTEVARTGLIDCRTSVKLAWSWPPRMAGSLLVLHWTERDAGPRRTTAVSAVILAVGFGREPMTAPSSPFPGYWDHDLLASVHGAKACLVLGAGDGGLYGDRLRRTLRGPAHRHAVTVVPPNRLMPRGVMSEDRRGRSDQGLERLALNAGGDCAVVIEWTKRSWHAPARIAVGHACDGIESLDLDRVATEPPRFFGARAVDPARHARALDAIAAGCRRRPFDFLVLGEFVLHADRAWAEATHRATGASVIAGIGHEREGAEQRHHRIAVFDPAAQRVTSKFAPSSYERASGCWTEDIHLGRRQVTIAISGDDQQTALIGGEDLGCLDAGALVRLRPDLLLVTGGPLAPETMALAAALQRVGARYVLVGIVRPHRASPRTQITVLV